MRKSTFIKKYNVIKIVGVFVFAVVLLWCILGIKANAAERADNDREEYQMQEKLLVEEVRSSLEAMGYYNSGITVTKVMDTDGSREYKVLVHHSDIDLQDMEEVNALYLAFNEISPDGENVTVKYTIF